MRTEKEMLDLILRVAQDEHIRAVTMNGSRTNSNAPKDIFQDYDIVYIVTELDYFINNNQWIDVFGEIMIMQTPENMSMFPASLNGRFTYLMQFTDGNRIDLMLVPLNQFKEYINEDKLILVLLDKDNIIPNISPSDENYWIKPPSKEFFNDCCNEFWWTSIYIAKGLWRNEILYAKAHMDNCVRPMLLKMIEWKVGIDYNFSITIGKYGKYLEKYVSKDIWDLYLSTYSDSDYKNTWNCLFTACDLFCKMGEKVAMYFRYTYPYETDKNVTQYLKYIQKLPYVIHF